MGIAAINCGQLGRPRVKRRGAHNRSSFLRLEREEFNQSRNGSTCWNFRNVPQSKGSHCSAYWCAYHLLILKRYKISCRITHGKSDSDSTFSKKQHIRTRCQQLMIHFQVKQSVSQLPLHYSK